VSRLVKLAEVYWHRLNDYGLASQSYEAALAGDPEALVTLKSAGRFFVQAKQWRHASRTLDRLLMKSSRLTRAETASFRHLRAQCAQAASEFIEAKQHLLEGLAADPQHRETLSLLAALSHEAKDWPDAFRYGRLLLDSHSALMKAGARSEVLYRLGFSREIMGDMNEATDYYRQAVEAWPGNAVARRAMESAPTIAGDWLKSDEAKGAAESVVVVMPSDEDDD
jgi:tetratricopeptide (TPR) repeat protein